MTTLTTLTTLTTKPSNPTKIVNPLEKLGWAFEGFGEAVANAAVECEQFGYTYKEAKMSCHNSITTEKRARKHGRQTIVKRK